MSEKRYVPPQRRKGTRTNLLSWMVWSLSGLYVLVGTLSDEVPKPLLVIVAIALGASIAIGARDAWWRRELPKDNPNG